MPTRRQFLQSSAAAAVLSPALVRGKSDKLGKLLPLRELGPKGEKVTTLGLGGYHVGKARDEKIAEALIERAMERGIRFFDNAVQYQGGLAETYYGKFLTPKYRDHVFLTTKSAKQSAKGVRAEFEDSLRRMKTERVDLWQLHAFTSVEDVKKRIEGGVVEVFLEMREKKMARYIGFTGHSTQEAHCYFLDHCKKEGIQMDTCLMPVNLADPHYDSFIVNVLPKLVEQKVSLTAMKTMAFGGIFARAKEVDPGVITPANLHGYAMSLPVSCLISGCETVEQVDENTANARDFEPMDPERRDELIAAVETIAGPELESYKGRV